MLKKALLIGMAGALATGLAFAAFAQGNATNEINTAHAHALPAQSASSVAMSHTHLHHVINCLAGPKEIRTTTPQAIPARVQGNSALTDSASNHALHGKLENALADAQAGLKSNTLAAEQGDTGKVANVLQSAGPAAKKAATALSLAVSISARRTMPRPVRLTWIRWEH